MKQFILYMFFISSLFANREVDIDKLINRIKSAPVEERYKEMNELKRILRSKNVSFRKEVLIKLQSNIHTPKVQNTQQHMYPDSEVVVPQLQQPPLPRYPQVPVHDLHVEPTHQPHSPQNQMTPPPSNHPRSPR